METYQPENMGRAQRSGLSVKNEDDVVDILPNVYLEGTTVGRIFQFGPGPDEVQVLVL